VFVGSLKMALWCRNLRCWYLSWIILWFVFKCTCYRSRWPRVLRRGFVAACLLGLWVRIPLGAWMFVTCECCVFSVRGLCVGLITRPEESYRLCYV